MPPAEPRNILIIDDSQDMHELLTLLLNSKGYSVSCRSNGEEALELLHSGGPLPNLILLDYHMPKMDGLAFLKARKSSYRLINIPVIMMTADDDVSQISGKFDIQQFLPKPVNMASVLSAVDQANWLH